MLRFGNSIVAYRYVSFLNSKQVLHSNNASVTATESWLVGELMLELQSEPVSKLYSWSLNTSNMYAVLKPLLLFCDEESRAFSIIKIMKHLYILILLCCSIWTHSYWAHSEAPSGVQTNPKEILKWIFSSLLEIQSVWCMIIYWFCGRMNVNEFISGTSSFKLVWTELWTS